MSKGTLRRTRRYDDSSDVISLFKATRTQRANELNESDDQKPFKLGTQHTDNLLAIEERPLDESQQDSHRRHRQGAGPNQRKQTRMQFKQNTLTSS